MITPPVVLTIGGSDSAGCYGVQADLRALAARGVHGACALTVVTAQNTTGMRSAAAVPVEVVEAQISMVLEDLPVAAVKTGMLGRVEVIAMVARLAADGQLPHLVVDPVLVNRHGHTLFGPDVCDAYRDLLIPHAVLCCPNATEAALLSGLDPLAAPEPAAFIRGLAPSTIVTAGRSLGVDAVDLFWDGAEVSEFRAPRIDTSNNAGSGDAFSAHVAAGLAMERSVSESITDAKAHVHAALVSAARWKIGLGPGPIDHLGWSR